MQIKDKFTHALNHSKAHLEDISSVFLKRKTLSFLTLSLLLLSIPLTVIQSVHIQDIRQRADLNEENCAASCHTKWCTKPQESCGDDYSYCTSQSTKQYEACQTNCETGQGSQMESCFTQCSNAKKKSDDTCKTNNCTTKPETCNQASLTSCTNTCYKTTAPTTPNPSCPKLPLSVPVAVIEFYPPSSFNEKNIDAEELSIQESEPIDKWKSKVQSIIDRMVPLLSEATRYHGYKDKKAPAFLKYEVVQKKVYTTKVPRGIKVQDIIDESGPVKKNVIQYLPDYGQIVKEINICDLVNNKGVREVWMFGYHSNHITPDESRMAGKYGSISNTASKEESKDYPDTVKMPICNTSYVLYNFNYLRDLDEAIHDRIHQIENVVPFAENKWPTSKENYQSSIFWSSFATRVYNGSLPIPDKSGCGNGHLTPVTTANNQEYLYSLNGTSKSNCENWNPNDSLSTFENISCSAWGCTQTGYYTWWMQNMPGFNNNISFNGLNMRNWWELQYDFDTFIDKERSLYTTYDWCPVQEGSPVPVPPATAPNTLPSCLSVGGTCSTGKSCSGTQKADSGYSCTSGTVCCREPETHPQPVTAPPTSSPSQTPLSPSKGSEASVNGEDGFANLREKPGIKQKIVDSIPNNTMTTIIDGPSKATANEDSYTWWKVKLTKNAKELTGWMSGSILGATTSPSPSSTATTTSPSPSSPKPSTATDPCEEGFYKIGGKPCPTPTPLPVGSIPKPSPSGNAPGASAPMVTSAPTRQTTCADNPIQPGVNKVWKAYCTATYKCVTSDDCRKALLSSAGNVQCYQFTNGSYCIQEQFDAIAGICRDNPETPPGSNQVWKADCSGKSCTKHSDCPQNPAANYKNNPNDKSNWCYGFDDGARCMMLQDKGSSSTSPSPRASSVKEQSSPSTNPVSSAWHTFTSWISGIFN